jgi:hypothetical protein
LVRVVVSRSRNGGANFYRTLILVNFLNCERGARKIEDFAVRLAEKVRDKQLSAEVAQRQLSEKYSFLTKDRLGHTWSQAMYFVIK